jgi:hypothetical protein
MPESKVQIPLAAHIRVDRGIYYHHGIHIGDFKVIHYTEGGGSVSKGKVKKTSLKRFLDGATKLDIVKHENPIFSPEEIIERAKSRIDEDDYSLFSNNCEHFCNWCIEGVAESEQVQTVVTILVAGLTGLNGLIFVKHIQEWIEKPHKELVKTTTNLLNTVKELDKVSQTALFNQFIYEKFVNESIKLDQLTKKQMQNIDKAGEEALEAIKKI